MRTIGTSTRPPTIRGAGSRASSSPFTTITIGRVGASSRFGAGAAAAGPAHAAAKASPISAPVRFLIELIRSRAGSGTYHLAINGGRRSREPIPGIRPQPDGALGGPLARALRIADEPADQRAERRSVAGGERLRERRHDRGKRGRAAQDRGPGDRRLQRRDAETLGERGLNVAERAAIPPRQRRLVERAEKFNRAVRPHVP